MSCGCLNKEKIKQNKTINIKGQSFGHLTVLRIATENEKQENNYNSREAVWLCKCECGNYTYVRSYDLRIGKTVSCGKCHRSKGEDAIKKILDDNNIQYIQQYKLEKYYCDFFVDNKYVIEYDGIQHFKSIPFFGGDKGLQDSIKRDNDKNKICFKNNIPIIRIPYNIDLKLLTLNDLLLETSQYVVQKEKAKYDF